MHKISKVTKCPHIEVGILCTLVQICININRFVYNMYTLRGYQRGHINNVLYTWLVPLIIHESSLSLLSRYFLGALQSSMAAVALRSCRRGLSQILSNGGVAALSSKRLEGLSKSPSHGRFYFTAPGARPKLFIGRTRGCGAHRLRRLKIECS